MTVHLSHPATGTRYDVPLYVDSRGIARYPIGGGAPDDDGGKNAEDAPDNPDNDGEEPDDDADKKSEDELGDAGKQALDRMKAQRNAAKAELREFKDLGLSPADIRKVLDARKKHESGDDDDKVDADAIREEARREARAEAAKERVEDKIEAKAARKFADPSDAVAILLRKNNINDFLDGDTVDAEAISEALDELLEEKPHLAAAQGDRKKFGGSADGGARKESRPKQLTRDDLSRMKPAEIVKAKAEGRLDDLLGNK